MMRIFSNDETGELAFTTCLLGAFFGLLWLGAMFLSRIPRLAGQIGLAVVFGAILAALVVVRVRVARCAKSERRGK